MLEAYLTVEATHKVCIGANDFGEALFAEKPIKCRLVDKFKEVSNDKGDKVVSSGVVQCVEAIKVGDYINDRRVIAIASMTSLDGILGYKGYIL